MGGGGRGNGVPMTLTELWWKEGQLHTQKKMTFTKLLQKEGQLHTGSWGSLTISRTTITIYFIHASKIF